MTRSLVDAPVVRTAFALAIPIFGGLSLLTTSQLVDAFWITRLGVEASAEFGRALPIITLLTTLSIGFGVATAALVSRHAGQKLEERSDSQGRLVGRLVALGIAFAVAASLVVLATSAVTADWASARPSLARFLFFWALGNPPLAGMMVLGSVRQGLGDAVTTTVIVSTAALINLVLDPLLIFGWGVFPALGLDGAALATTLAHVAAFAVACRRFRATPLEVPALTDLKRTDVYRAGLPSMVSTSLPPLGNLIVVLLISTHSPEGMAVFALFLVCERALYNVPLSLSNALIPIVGHNWGARHFPVIRRGAAFSLAFAAMWGVLLVAASSALGAPLGRWLFDEPMPATQFGELAPLHAAVIGLISAQVLGNALFIGVQKPSLPMSWMAVERLAVTPALVFLGVYHCGLAGACLGLIAGRLACVAAAYLVWLGFASAHLSTPAAAGTVSPA